MRKQMSDIEALQADKLSEKYDNLIENEDAADHVKMFSVLSILMGIVMNMYEDVDLAEEQFEALKEQFDKAVELRKKAEEAGVGPGVMYDDEEDPKKMN